VKRFVLWALLAASLSANTAVAAVVLWQRRAGPPEEPLVFSRVALDESQRARISELRSQLLSTRDEHSRRMAQLRRELASAVMREPQDAAAVDAALRSIAGAQASYQRAVVEHFLAVRDVLRPEQRPSFEKMVGEHMTLGGGMDHCAGCALRPSE
jgi:Spy/CpxP family protein refolding chaperone